MTTETGAPGGESGGEFRQKFEATQAEAAALRGQLAEQLGVDAEALKGVPADQVVAKATEIKTAQAAAEEAVLRKHLGIGEDGDLEAALAKVKGEGGDTQTPTGTSDPTPFTSTGSLGGTPPTGKQTEGLYGRDRIRAAMGKDK